MSFIIIFCRCYALECTEINPKAKHWWNSLLPSPRFLYLCPQAQKAKTIAIWTTVLGQYGLQSNVSNPSRYSWPVNNNNNTHSNNYMHCPLEQTFM